MLSLGHYLNIYNPFFCYHSNWQLQLGYWSSVIHRALVQPTLVSNLKCKIYKRKVQEGTKRVTNPKIWISSAKVPLVEPLFCEPFWTQKEIQIKFFFPLLPASAYFSNRFHTKNLQCLSVSCKIYSCFVNLIFRSVCTREDHVNYPIVLDDFLYLYRFHSAIVVPPSPYGHDKPVQLTIILLR